MVLLLVTSIVLTSGCRKREEERGPDLSSGRSLQVEEPQPPEEKLEALKSLEVVEGASRVGPQEVSDTVEVSDQQDHKAPLLPPPIEIPKYPDGTFRFWFVDDRFGVPVGFHRIAEGDRVFREHFEFTVLGGRVERVTVKGPFEGVREIREYEYGSGPNPDRPVGYRVLNKMGTTVETVSYNEDISVLTAKSITGETLLSGCQSRQVTRRGDGLAIGETCQDASGDPAPDETGVVTTKLGRDELGMVTSREFFGGHNDPVTNQEGVHREVLERNLDGEVSAINYFGIKGERVVNERLRGARVEFEWSPKGLLLRERYLGVAGEPVLNAFGIHEVLYENSVDGMLVKKQFLDTGRKPVIPVGFRATEVRYGYNRDHFLIRQSFWKESDQSGTDGRGVHMERFEVNGTGDVVSASRFGPDFAPLQESTLPHRTNYEYGPDGFLKAVTYWDPQGKKAYGGSPSAHREERMFDSKHRVTTLKYYDLRADTRRLYGDLGAIRVDYDDNGHWVRKWFTDSQGATFNARGLKYAAEVREYDLSGRPAKACFKNADGVLVSMPRLKDMTLSGFACRLWQYGRFGRPEAMTFLDASGEDAEGMVRVRRGWSPATRVDFLFEGGYLAEERFFSKDASVPSITWDCRRVRCVEPTKLNR